MFSIIPEPDPRLASIRRYLRSPRCAAFIRMALDWGGTPAIDTASTGEQVVVHQHIVVHLKTLSADSRSVIDEMYYEVVFAASLFTALAFLLPVSIAALWTSRLASREYASFGTGIYLTLIAIVWLGGIVSAYSVKRRFREFCNRALTLALHFHTTSTDVPLTGAASGTVPVGQLLGSSPAIR